MKRLFGIFLTVFVCFSIFSVAAAADRDNYVIDEAGLLEDKEIEKLSENIEDLSDKYNMDIVLLTVDSLNGKTPNEFADDFYDYNGYAEDGIHLAKGRTARYSIHERLRYRSLYRLRSGIYN